MKLTNTTDWPNHFLRRMAVWCCRQLELPVRCVRHAHFGKRRHGWRGTAQYRSSFSVRIGETKYPTHSKYRPDAPMNDVLECLVSITAHELAHLEHWRHARSAKTRERYIDTTAQAVLDTFRRDRESLLAEWSIEPAAKPDRPKASVAEKRAAKALADLERWQRKAKLAATKIRKLKARVRYYEKRQAATRPGPTPDAATPQE